MKRVVFILLNVCAFLWAGPNSSAKLYIDTDISSSSIDSIGWCKKDSTFTTGIKITKAVNLFSFEVYLKYDTSALEYISIKKDAEDYENFLESSGGSVSVPKKWSKNDSTLIHIYAFLLGDDPDLCVNGSGWLAFLTFKLKKSDTTELYLTDPIILDCDLDDDDKSECHSAKIIPGKSAVISRKSRVKYINQVNVIDKKVQVSLSGNALSEISITDFSGRILQKNSNVQNRTILDLSRTGTGIFILKVSQGGNVQTCPLLIQ